MSDPVFAVGCECQPVTYDYDPCEGGGWVVCQTCGDEVPCPGCDDCYDEDRAYEEDL